MKLIADGITYKIEQTDIKILEIFKWQDK